jgi:hypothetical protein
MQLVAPAGCDISHLLTVWTALHLVEDLESSPNPAAQTPMSCWPYLLAK